MEAGISLSYPAPDVPLHDHCAHLFVLSGPSGVGKDTLLQRLRTEIPHVRVAVTATTRAPRPGEVHGVNYFFISHSRYKQLLQQGDLLAPARVHGHCYGAPMTPIRQSLEEGHDVLLKIDVQGAAQVREVVDGATSIFLAPPSFAGLVDRLQARQTEGDDDLRLRLDAARDEMAQAPEYDYVVVNHHGQLDRAVHQVRCIMEAAHLRTHQRPVVLPIR